MATSVTVNSSSAVTVNDVVGGPPPLQAESISIVDLRLLSQSELYSLSLCSSSAFNPRRDDDVVIPKIDRSVFNESAGSRKQTYSRLRLAPAAAAAAAAASSSSVIRSRTPHLRNSSLQNSDFNSGSENSESSQIVTMLKQLFGSGSSTAANPTDLVPSRVDYSDSFSVPAPAPVPVPELGNVGSIGQKRKRGRPKRNENSGVVEVKAAKADVEVKDIVVYQNVDERDDRDKEIMNKDGVPVDLAALGALEDPFGQELRRRTEGLGSGEELLGFLGRLNGQWGSTRKKRRIVDAGEFGSTLPKGWKLLLSVKRKGGHAWVHCRRYISPNGRHFGTCKEISSYLLFLHGERNENLPTYAKSSETVEITNACALVSTSADLRVQDGGEKESSLFHNSAPAVGHGEFQGLLNFGELSEVQVGDLLHCDKCNVTFNNKNDLLKHQLSSHQKRRSRNGGQSITDGVIIKDGKFECQFCHKTFEEKHRYNGHVGNHVKYQLKTADGSLPIKMGGYVEPVVSSRAMLREPIMQDSVVPLRNLTENAGASVDDGDNHAPPSKIQEDDHMETDDKLEGPAEGTNKGCHNQEDISVSSPISSNEKTCTDISKVIVCSNIEEPKQEGLLCSNGVVDSCGVSVEDGKFFPTVDESKLESDRLVDAESTTALCRNASLPDENSLISARQVPLTEDHSGKNIDVLNGVSFLSETSKENRDFKSSLGTPSCDKEGSTVDYVGVHSGQDSYSFVPHPDEHVNTAERDVTDVSACVLDGLAQQKGDGSSLLSPSCDKNSEIESQIFNDLKRSADEPKINQLQSVTSDIVGFTSSNNHAVQKVDASNIEKEKSLAFCSLFPVTNARASCAEDHDTKVYQSTMEVNDQQRSASALFSSTNVPEASTKEYTMNRSYNNSLDESKFGLENSRHHDLNVVFSNSHVDLGANLNCTTFQLGMEETYGVQDNLHRRLETDKHGEVGIDLSNSTFKGKTGDFGSNFNTVFHGQLWDEQKVDEVDNSGKKIITSFGCGDAKPNEDVMAGSIWRTGVENVIQGGSADNSTSVAQSSNCFQNYDVLSDKVHTLFGENEKYDGNTGFDGLRSDRSGPVEYSFMGTHSLNSLQEEPQVYIEQGFNSSFWLGKDNVMPNLAGRNPTTVVCVWCRNEFYQEPDQLGAEAGSIGFMCPTCSGRISGQFSFM
ncbi:putative LRR receptor-like serine/threonine-protein kinase-like [Capsicum annuum]|nr:putative LRR receptor-like serine/threonine-protein kinase-like [Capsicum annuum]